MLSLALIVYVAKLFFWFVLSLLILVGTGTLINLAVLKRPFSFGKNLFSGVFFNILLSCLLISAITAIVFSGGKTLQWVILLSLIWVLYALRKKGFESDGVFFIGLKEIKLNEVLMLFVAAAFSFAFLFSLLGLPENSLKIGVYYDFYFYAKLSSALIETGIENPTAMLANYQVPNNLSLYHYTDLWFTGLFSKMTPLAESETLLFITYPILLFVTILGAAGILSERFGSNGWVLLVFSILLIFGISVVLPLDGSPLYQQALPRYGGGLALYPVGLKTLILFPLILLSFSFLEKGRLDLTALGIILAMTAYNTVIPAYIGGLALLFVYAFFEKKVLSQPVLQKTGMGVVSLGVFLIFLWGFIHLFIQSENLPVEQGALPIRSIIIIFIESIISPWLFFWITGLIILFFLYKKKLQGIPFIVFLAGAQLAAALFVVVTHGTQDAGQALSNSLPALLVATSVFLIKDLPFKKIGLIFLFIAFTVSAANNAFQGSDKLRSEIKNSDHFMSIVESDFKSLAGHQDWFALGFNPGSRWHYNWFNPGSFIFNIKNAGYPLDVSGFLFQKENEWCELNNNKVSPLCMLWEKEKHLTAEEVFVTLLNEGPASFLYAESPDLVPLSAKPCLSLIATDQNTGEVFYRIVK